MQVEEASLKAEDTFVLPRFGKHQGANRIECYFAEINDLAQQMDYSEAGSDKPATKPIHLLRQRRPNCYVQVESDGLLVMSKGGSSFHIPLEQHIEHVFPLSEGLLIQYVVKHDPKFAEILQYQKNKHLLHHGDDQPKYSYVTLNKHPLNPLKVLGCLKKEQIQPWLNIPERIVFASSQVPLLISYNHLLQRNAFHLLKANIEESEREMHRVNFTGSFYTIKDLSEASPGNCELLSELFFEENTREFAVQECLLTKGHKAGELHIYMLIENEIHCYVKVYAVNILEGCQVRLLAKIPDVVGFHTHRLIQNQQAAPKLLKRPVPRYNDLQAQVLLKALGRLPEFVVVVDHSSYCICLAGTPVYRAPVLLHNKVVQMRQVVFSTEDRFEVVTADGVKFEQLTLKQISDPMACLFLSVLREIVDERLFERMLGDLLQLRNSIHSDFRNLKDYLLGLMRERSHSTVSQARSVTPEQFAPIKSRVLKVLHLLYQEVKLFQHFPLRQELLDTLYTLNLHSGDETSLVLFDYYVREGAHSELTDKPLFKHQSKNDPELIDLFKGLCDLLQAKKTQWELGSNPQPIKMPLAFRRTKLVYRLFELLLDGTTGHRSYVPEYMKPKEKHDIMGLATKDVFSDSFPLHHQKVFYMSYYRKKIEGFLKLQELKNAIDNKQQKVFLYLIEKGLSLEKIKTFPLGIGTPIYEILRIMRRHLPGVLYEVIPRLGFSLIKREDLHKNIKLYRKQPIRPPYHLLNQSLSSTIHTLIHSSVSEEYYLTSNTFEMNKFNNDLVFKEVSRLLTSTTDIKIKAKEIGSIPEDKWEAESQAIVMKFANRRLSVLAGQGAFTLGTSQTYITEIIKINKINLSSILPSDTKITLDLKDDKEAHVYWPEFHNGVAAGLKLSRHIIPLSQDHLKTWIFYQKPELPKRDHSGFLLSLGLLGYLQCFSPTDIYQYLKPNNEFTSAAILLGVSASSVGKCEESLSKTLILHIPCLLPPTVDIEIPINVQTSALIGIGLLHKGTSNRTMTEMTLSQIGRRPNSDKCLDREGYSLAAGWALGVICLGMNGTKESLRDLQLEQRLIRFIEGGRTMQPPQSMISSNFNNENKCSSIKEGNTVNLHITAPSALLAISLMYLKSNNRDVSNQITIPNSFNTIEQCNPNHILLKVIARNLIMWRNIDNTQEFVLGQIPELIRFIYENSLNAVHERYYLVYNVTEIDYHTITVIFASIMTGAIVAMGMKYAGTGDKRAVATIQWHIDKLRSMKILKCELANDPNNKNSIDQYNLFTLLCVSMLSLSLVMAGTCDVECLKIARIIRKRVQETANFHYGFNMAVNMSIGFLCLGYGNYSFNRSDMSIAALLISIYPYFPNSPSDNKWHLQALRHFYVLAVQEKVFHAVDVDTNKVVNVNIELQFEVDGSIVNEQLRTPVLLQQSRRLVSLRVRDEDFFDVDFTFEPKQPQPKVIYIKKKFSKEIDLHHFKSLNPEDYEHLPVTSETAADIKKAFNKETKFKAVRGLATTGIDLNTLSYVLPNCKNQQVVLAALKKDEQEKRFWTSLSFNEIYYEFMKEDRLDILEGYLAILKSESDITQWKTHRTDNIKLLRCFYDSAQLVQGINGEASMFFNPTKLALLYGHYQKLAMHEFDKLSKTEAFRSYLTKPECSHLPVGLVRVLNFFNVPNKHELKLIRKFFEKLRAMHDSNKPRQQENFHRNLASVCEMYLYMSFPGCPVNVLNRLAEFFLQQ